MSYYFADRVRSEQYRWGGRRTAHVMHGTLQGRFVAIAIRVPGTGWICHPSPDGDTWSLGPKNNQKGRPPRWVRKEAKMALRRFLNP